MKKERGKKGLSSGTNLTVAMPTNKLLENMRYRLSKPRRLVKPRGDSGSGNRRLTNEQVRQIRIEYRPGVVTAKMLAEKYGVTPDAIRKIINGYSRASADLEK